MRFARLLAPLLLLATLLGGCGTPAEKAPRWNVLLVTFDTTRADRIGCYGNQDIQTPTLDGLAAEGVRFARAMSAVPITAPSHSTILTGRYPIAHGVRDNGLFVLGDEQTTLAEILGREGYATAAAVGAFPVTSQFGLNQGFDLFDDHLTGAFEDYLGERVIPKERLFFDERRAAQVNEALFPWLEEHADGSFFAWAHYFDPHQPFEPPPPYDQLYLNDLYNGEIAYTDSRLGFLLDHLEKLGVLDNTLVIMTADHGEGLGDHNEETHAVLAYNTTLHVPLLIRPPAGTVPPGTVVERQVGTVDIVPTVLDLLGIEHPEGLQGRSLAALMRHGDEHTAHPTQRYAENLSPRLTHSWGELRVLFDGPLKYIHGPRPELYDLEEDPRELNDLAAENPDEVRRMRATLESFIERYAVSGVSAIEDLDDDVRRRLESLGYLHSAATPDQPITETLQDGGTPPQDRVGDINDLSAAKHLLFKGRMAEALRYTEKLIARSPEDPLYLELHASALAELGRLEEAWQWLERLREAGVNPEPLVLRLLARRFETGEQRRALEDLGQYVEIAPTPRAFWLLSVFHKRLEDRESSRQALEHALELEDTFLPARLDLAIHLAQAGDPEGAERELNRALQDAPYSARAHYNYAVFLLQNGRYTESIQHLRRALALAPRYPEAHLALVAVSLTIEDRDQAQEAYEALTRLAPKSPQAATAAELLAGES